jgi:hypothetical protein
MALPGPGVPLSLTDIQGEFGGANPISLSEYYAGGGLVAPGTTGTYGAVPSSGQISIQNFYGTAATGPLSIIIDPSVLTNVFSGSGFVNSDPVTGIASGGSGGYSYAWTFVSGDTYTINFPSAATTTFFTFLSEGQYKLGNYRCTVTDSSSATAYADISVTLESF